MSAVDSRQEQARLGALCRPWREVLLDRLLLFAAPLITGAVFLALYAGSWYLGGKIDRERAERTAAWEAEQAGQAGEQERMAGH